MTSYGPLGALLLYRLAPSLLCSWPSLTADMAILSILFSGMKTSNLTAISLFIMAIGTLLRSLTWRMFITTAL